MSGWDLTNVQESGGGIKEGEYTATIESAVVKQTKDGQGEYINAKFKLSNGQSIYHMFNVKNANEKAVTIGLGQIKTVLRASGKKDPNSLNGVDELLGLRLNVLIKDKTDDYGTKPRITAFKPAPKGEASPVNPFG